MGWGGDVSPKVRCQLPAAGRPQQGGLQLERAGFGDGPAEVSLGPSGL